MSFKTSFSPTTPSALPKQGTSLTRSDPRPLVGNWVSFLGSHLSRWTRIALSSVGECRHSEQAQLSLYSRLGWFKTSLKGLRFHWLPEGDLMLLMFHFNANCTKQLFCLNQPGFEPGFLFQNFATGADIWELTFWLLMYSWCFMKAKPWTTLNNPSYLNTFKL